MTALTTVRFAYSTEASILKAVYLKPFSSKSVKTKIFILQVNNKIADAAEASEERKIKYNISLLRGSAVK